MSRFRLDIEYVGTRYSGWQMQKNGRTIQGKLIEAAEKIFKGEKVELQGSGRTDAGVHAINQVAHLEVKTMLAPEIIKMKFNDLLPADINILEVSKANKNFHARHDAIARSYIYQISKRRTAFGKQFVWWIKDKLDVEYMKQIGGLFEGMHDFASFADKDADDKSTKVLVEAIQFKEEGDLILIRIIGSHFLWKMVRRIVGVLVEAGRHKLNEKDVAAYLNTFTREPTKYTAPPSGLFLETVVYQKNYKWGGIEPVVNLLPSTLFSLRKK
ncbi:tRNA pseudouridine(38-40) synthase TruA [Melioribacter sp. OK-6-Me]|uniref:tRNA pseudouridine(38-40) synthase TruA n=1 Tax=unclassified Melioribacter TaxID=2627329 RepID=UPI003ED9FC41